MSNGMATSEDIMKRYKELDDEDRGELVEYIVRLEEALGKISRMTRDMEHDLFSATRVAAAALAERALEKDAST